MRRALHFAWLTAVAGVVFANRRRKVVLSADRNWVWSVRPGGHEVVDETGNAVVVQTVSRVGRAAVRPR